MKLLLYGIRTLFVALYRSWLALKQSLFRPSNAFVNIEINGISEQPNPFGFLGSDRMSLFDYRALLKRAEKDPNVEGVVVRIKHLGGAGFGKVEELREYLRELGHSGKFTAAYLEEAGTREYYLATACKRIFMLPTGNLGPLGLHMQQPFLKGMLEKLGVEPELQHIGDYKTASDMFMREEASESHREMLDWILDGFYDEIMQEIHVRRGLSEEEVRDSFDEGFLDGEQAKEAGLVDELFYEKDLEDWIREQSSDQYRPVSDTSYRQQRIPDEISWVPPRRIAVLFANGSIHSGRGQFFPSPTVGSSTMVETIRDIRESMFLDGVLFRINSGGGSAVASDVIAREIQRLREDEEIPVVASMSDVAGSGGYYIAALADPILANRTTLTGSIGVVLGKFNLEELQEKAGVSTDHFDRGDRAGMMSPLRKLKGDEKEKMKTMMHRVYDTFLDVVEEGRGKDREELKKVAGGRVWTGKQARDHDLVDELGGFDRALKQLKSRMGLALNRPVKLIPMPFRHLNLFGSLGGGANTLLRMAGKFASFFQPVFRWIFSVLYRRQS